MPTKLYFGSLLISLVQSVGGDLTLRQQIYGLNNGVTPVGRTSVAAAKVPGVDALPAGVSFSSSSITFGPSYAAGAFEGWDLRQRTIIVQAGATVPAIRQCLIGLTGAGTIFNIFDVYGTLGAIEYNTIVGPYGQGRVDQVFNQRPFGSGATATFGQIGAIRYNDIRGFPFDVFKLAGATAGQVVEWNRIKDVANLIMTPIPYAVDVNFGLGDIAKDSTGTYKSLVADNLGNPFPTGSSTTRENTWWKRQDPHADCWTVFASKGGVTIRRNYCEWKRPPLETAWDAMGFTNLVRVVRNVGTTYPIEAVTFEENVCLFEPADSYTLQVAEDGTPIAGPIAFRNNWLTPNKNGVYFHPSTNGLVDEWSGNRDTLTDAVIAGPTLRPPVAAAPYALVSPSGATDFPTIRKLQVSLDSGSTWAWVSDMAGVTVTSTATGRPLVTGLPTTGPAPRFRERHRPTGNNYGVAHYETYVAWSGEPAPQNPVLHGRMATNMTQQGTYVETVA